MPRFHLDIMVDADLVQLPPVLKRLVKNNSFIKQLDLIKDLKGKATGRLVLGASTAVIKNGCECLKISYLCQLPANSISSRYQGGALLI